MTVQEGSKRAKEVNQSFFCVTDHGSMGAVPRQIQACEEHGRHPIFGCELYVQPMQPELKPGEKMSDHTEGMSPEEKKRLGKSYHLLALATSQRGYSNLVNLSSAAWTRGFYYKPRVNHELLMKHKDGIIFTSCCYNSEIGQAFDKGGDDAGFAMVEKYMGMFGRDNFYLEIMLLDFVKQKPYNQFIIRAHDRYGLPVILTQDCLVPGSMILTSRGNKKIEDVKIGDSVLTHAGNFRKVECTNTRKLSRSEKVYRVKAAMGTLAWEVTGNHQVRVASESFDFGWKRVDQLTQDDFLVVPKIDQSFVFAKKSPKKICLLDIIPESEYLCGRVNPKSLKLRLKRGHFVSHRGADRRSTIKIPCSLPLTDDLLKIIGLYMAEGGLDQGNQISFGLHVREKEEERLLKRYFGKFGIGLTKYVSGNGVKIEFQSVVFRRFFESICGKGCKNKTLPRIKGRFFGVFSKRQVLTIVKQYWLGDGYFSKGRAACLGSTSKSLIYDLACVFNSLGLPVVPHVRNHKACKRKHKNPNAKPENWSDFYCVAFSGVSRSMLEHMIGTSKKSPMVRKNNKGMKYIEHDSCYLAKVKSVKEIEYQGLVYNLQVEKDESYVANLFQAHNCHYARREDSKMQRLMLMVQTRRTIQEIQEKLEREDTADLFELQDTNLWMKSEEELNEKWLESYSDSIPLEFFEEAKRNTVRVAERCKGVELDRSVKLPYIEDADAKLLEYISQGYRRRMLPKGDPVYMRRIKEEYDLICSKGFASYFIIQKMMTDEARRISRTLLGYGDGSEAVGPGRGSAVGALTCYCLGITDVDPIEHDLLFSRFLSPARGGKQMKLRFTIDPVQMTEELAKDIPFEVPIERK